MADEERYGTRSLTYSAWHRIKSTCRFVGIENAQRLAMIDVDHIIWVEYEDENKEPLALIEEAEDVGQNNKPSTVTRGLAQRANLPAMLVLWKPSKSANPASPDWPDIERFRVKRLWPLPQSKWRELTPEAWASVLLRLRTWQAERLDRELFGDST